MRTFSEMDKHYDRHNEGICAVCGCTTARWKSVCDACRQTENDCKYKDGTLLFGGHKLKEGGNTQ